jgi:tetratricopeptide (TPR) repeat protein
MAMHRLLRLIPLVPLSLLAACATSPAADAGLRPSQPVPAAGAQSSAYGLFLAARSALAKGDNAQAADLYRQASDADGGAASEVRQGAFISALLAGDVPRAAALAPQDADVDSGVRQMGRLVRAVDALALGKAKDAYLLMAPAGFDANTRAAAALLTPIMASAAGETEAASIRPNPRINGVVQYFGQLVQAQTLERAKRFEEAETDYKLLTAPEAPTGALFLLDYGAFLERRGRKADALALYGQGLAKNPADPGLQSARQRAASGRRPPAAPTPQEQAVRVLVACASLEASADDNDTSMAYLRLALRLDPNRADAWLQVGDLLAENDPEGARAAYAHAPKGSDLYVQAMSRIAMNYQTAGQSEAALTSARAAVAAAPNSRDAAVTLAELLRATDKVDDAVAVLDKLIARPSSADDWRLLFLRGTMQAEAGRKMESERDVAAALVIAPDQPELLNYLGYMWIDRGDNLPKALEMVKKAVALQPRSGAIIDSLGWAYFRLGDYRLAVQTLERAVLLEPADPDVNDHLGDAYWKVGRKIEAKFQWSRVLSLDPPAEAKARAELKLRDGLDAAPKAAPVAAAGPAAAATPAVVASAGA